MNEANIKLPEGHGFTVARGYASLRQWLKQTERKCFREGVKAEDRGQTEVADAMWSATDYLQAARRALPRRDA